MYRDAWVGQRDGRRRPFPRSWTHTSRQHHRHSRPPLPNRALSAARSCYYGAADPSVAPGVDFPTPGGLLLDEMEEILKLIGENLQIKAAALTAYNPENEIANKTLQTGFKLVNTILKIVENQLASSL